MHVIQGPSGGNYSQSTFTTLSSDNSVKPVSNGEPQYRVHREDRRGGVERVQMHNPFTRSHERSQSEIEQSKYSLWYRMALYR
jgi:hypothetical protein